MRAAHRIRGGDAEPRMLKPRDRGTKHMARHEPRSRGETDHESEHPAIGQSAEVVPECIHDIVGHNQAVNSP